MVFFFKWLTLRRSFSLEYLSEPHPLSFSLSIRADRTWQCKHTNVSDQCQGQCSLRELTVRGDGLPTPLKTQLFKWVSGCWNAKVKWRHVLQIIFKASVSNQVCVCVCTCANVYMWLIRPGGQTINGSEYKTAHNLFWCFLASWSVISGSELSNVEMRPFHRFSPSKYAPLDLTNRDAKRGRKCL